MLGSVFLVFYPTPMFRITLSSRMPPPTLTLTPPFVNPVFPGPLLEFSAQGPFLLYFFRRMILNSLRIFFSRCPYKPGPTGDHGGTGHNFAPMERRDSPPVAFGHRLAPLFSLPMLPNDVLVYLFALSALRFSRQAGSDIPNRD